MISYLLPRIIDRYIAKQVYLSILFVLAALFSLFIFFDLIAEFKYVGENYPAWLAITIVLLRTPAQIVVILPITCLVGATYTFATLATSNEFTIFRIAGVSVKNAALLLLKIGIPVVVLTFVLSEMVGPATEYLSKTMRNKVLGANFSLEFKTGAWIKDKVRDPATGQVLPGERYINIGLINKNNELQFLRMFEFDSRHRLRKIYTANRVQYNSSGTWNLIDANETTFTELETTNVLDPQVTSRIDKKNSITIATNINPELLGMVMIKPHHMSITALYQYMNHLEENKQDSKRFAVAFWKKVIYPFTALVMLLLALPFAYLNARSGSIGIKVFAGILLGVSFHLFNNLFSHFGILGNWPTLMAALVPPAIYSGIAFFGLHYVSKSK